MTKTSLCFVSRPSFEHGLHTPLVRRHIAWATSYFLTHFSFRKGIYSKVLLLLLSISLSLSSPDMPIQSKINCEYVIRQHTLASDSIRALLKIDAHVSTYTYLWYAYTQLFLRLSFSYYGIGELILLFYHWDSNYRLIFRVWSDYIRSIIIISIHRL